MVSEIEDAIERFRCPPLLAPVGVDRFTLAPEHGAELAFILARSAAGSRAR